MCAQVRRLAAANFLPLYFSPPRVRAERGIIVPEIGAIYALRDLPLFFFSRWSFVFFSLHPSRYAVLESFLSIWKIHFPFPDPGELRIAVEFRVAMCAWVGRNGSANLLVKFLVYGDEFFFYSERSNFRFSWARLIFGECWLALLVCCHSRYIVKVALLAASIKNSLSQKKKHFFQINFKSLSHTWTLIFFVKIIVKVTPLSTKKK